MQCPKGLDPDSGLLQLWVAWSIHSTVLYKCYHVLCVPWHEKAGVLFYSAFLSSKWATNWLHRIISFILNIWRKLHLYRFAYYLIFSFFLQTTSLMLAIIRGRVILSQEPKPTALKSCPITHNAFMVPLEDICKNSISKGIVHQGRLLVTQNRSYWVCFFFN